MNEPSVRRAAGDAGAALVLVLIAMAVLTALGVSLAILADTDGRMASSYRAGTEAFYAADAVVEWTVQELSGVVPWNDAIGGTGQSSFHDSTRQPLLPSGGRVDLDAITVQIQAQTDASVGLGPDRPLWRLFAWGPLSRMTGLDPGAVGTYVAAWVADDVGDGDGNAGVDANGVLTVHAEAFGSAGTKRIIEVVVATDPPVAESPAGSAGGPMFAVTSGATASVWQGPAKSVSVGAGSAAVRVLTWREVR